MIEKIIINKYKKLEDIDFYFTPKINVISGTNGTCKTTLLHIVSNAFKAAKVASDNYSNASCVKVVKNNNIIVNPKIESLVRDAKNYSDPAKGKKGELFDVHYTNGNSLSFRKHNSEQDERYAIKPYYSGGQSLPPCNIIYLGLSRLFPVGEVEDGDISQVKSGLPEDYMNLLSTIYEKLTHIKIDNIQISKVSDFKLGPEFVSPVEGIDSNTISSGEDNLFIILKALVSLAYFHDSLINKDDDVSSILLIDEYDATLHPSLQDKLYDIMNEFSEKYKIQIFITTHSLSLLEYVLEKRDNLIYLHNDINSVFQVKDPSIIDIKMHLKNETRSEIYNKKKIPIFTEDDEARIFLNAIFDYYEILNKNFSKIRRFFHLVECKVGADNLVSIFSDNSLLDTTIKSICVLDGDKKLDINRCTIKLPGDKSPEVICFEHAEHLYQSDDRDFWRDATIRGLGYTKTKFLSDIREDISSIEEKVRQVKEITGSSKGVARDLNKKRFEKHLEFFDLVFRDWISDEKNKKDISKFYSNLKTIFFKVSMANGIEKKEWDFDMEIANDA
ncbi:AAA family ATPase [Pectobacterium brasiliense]|uniref:ATP-dependent nuclease n=1 Tax=Pectobacterium brasiliense TaxID=180957 RepID=UPI0019694295|nr:AAA family ATPase [Pectobacterium brasiliense]MBN3131604.1 AAA family ATPase [Pectobacterium brasiliense]